MQSKLKIKGGIKETTILITFLSICRQPSRLPSEGPIVLYQTVSSLHSAVVMFPSGYLKKPKQLFMFVFHFYLITDVIEYIDQFVLAFPIMKIQCCYQTYTVIY